MVENYKKGIDSLVFAVCGSGKTEITLDIMSYVISSGGKVCFAIPRKDVVIEITKRLKDIFTSNKVIAVYGDHHQELEGDIVCLTAHQLYRYERYFDLIVMDEIDAFPFKEDETLHAFFFRALKGHFIQMSATPSDEVIKYFSREGFDVLRLDVRYHRHPIPIPKIVIKHSFFRYLELIRLINHFKKEKKPVFVFAPTISMCEQLYLVISKTIKKVNYVHSKRDDRTKIIEDFKKGKIDVLVTTAVLERGVTVKNLQVVVFDSDNYIYDKAALVQISGRVGRKKDAPEGEVIFIARRKTKHMEKAIDDIKRSNKVLQDMLQRDKNKNI